MLTFDVLASAYVRSCVNKVDSIVANMACWGGSIRLDA